MAQRLYCHTHTALLLQLRLVVSLRIRLSSSRIPMLRSQSFGQASLLRADSLVIVVPTPAWCDVQECTSTA